MSAVVVTLKQAGSGRLVDAPDPQPRDGEVLVKVREAGLHGPDAETDAENPVSDTSPVPTTPP